MVNEAPGINSVNEPVVCLRDPCRPFAGTGRGLMPLKASSCRDFYDCCKLSSQGRLLRLLQVVESGEDSNIPSRPLPVTAGVWTHFLIFELWQIVLFRSLTWWTKHQEYSEVMIEPDRHFVYETPVGPLPVSAGVSWVKLPVTAECLDIQVLRSRTLKSLRLTEFTLY